MFSASATDLAMLLYVKRTFKQRIECILEECVPTELACDLNFVNPAAPVSERKSYQLLLPALLEEDLDVSFPPLAVYVLAEGLQSAVLKKLVSSLLIHSRQRHIELQAFENLALKRLYVQTDPTLLQEKHMPRVLTLPLLSVL